MADERKKKKTALMMASMVPGGHRFYTGHTGTGVLQLLTGGGCGLWQLWDIIQIFRGQFLDANGNTLED